MLSTRIEPYKKEQTPNEGKRLISQLLGMDKPCENCSNIITLIRPEDNLEVFDLTSLYKEKCKKIAEIRNDPSIPSEIQEKITKNLRQEVQQKIINIRERVFYILDIIFGSLDYCKRNSTYSIFPKMKYRNNEEVSKNIDSLAESQEKKSLLEHLCKKPISGKWTASFKHPFAPMFLLQKEDDYNKLLNYKISSAGIYMENEKLIAINSEKIKDDLEKIKSVVRHESQHSYFDSLKTDILYYYLNIPITRTLSSKKSRSFISEGESPNLILKQIEYVFRHELSKILEQKTKNEILAYLKNSAKGLEHLKNFQKIKTTKDSLETNYDYSFFLRKNIKKAIEENKNLPENFSKIVDELLEHLTESEYFRIIDNAQEHIEVFSQRDLNILALTEIDEWDDYVYQKSDKKVPRDTFAIHTGGSFILYDDKPEGLLARIGKNKSLVTLLLNLCYPWKYKNLWNLE